jgi:hypothetical protein
MILDVKLANNGTKDIRYEYENGLIEFHLTMVNSEKLSPRMTDQRMRRVFGFMISGLR